MVLFNSGELEFSIVNTAEYDRTTAIDITAPYSFFDFIKYLRSEYAPELYSPLYSSYLKEWYGRQDATVEEQKELYITFYKEFMEQVILNYTTQTEKEFLQKADFNSVTDLDIIIPFYANRLTEIATFYKNKRESGKYIINENKVKGSRYGLERAIFDSIYNYVVNTQDFIKTAEDTSISNVINDFGVSIAEYVDVYGDYFDITREETKDSTVIDVLSSLRSDLYQNNVVDIKNEYYTDPEAIEILRESSFLSSIDDFKINPPAFSEADITALCNPDQSLVKELNEVFTVGGLTLAEVYDLKRQLISKYASCDFYFLNTSALFGTVTGVLFEAENPTSNLLNLQTADIAAVQSGEQQLLRDTGLNFKPDDIGLFKLNSGKCGFEIDTANLEDNKVYIFPDPNIYGNVGVNTLSSYPYVYTFDFNDNIRNISSGIATGDPKITNKSLTFEPYTTKQRETQEFLNLNRMSYKLNFTDLYNKGMIRKMAYDSYGNEYALFKPEGLQQRDTVSKSFILSLQLNGHEFFDDTFDEGYNFNYSTAACDFNTKRSGIRANLGGFKQEVEPLYINLREFTPYQELGGIRVCNIGDIENNFETQSDFTTNRVGIWRDGGEFTKQDGTLLPDPLKTTDVTYPGAFNYYYDILADSLDRWLDARDIAGSQKYNCGRFTDVNLVDKPFSYETDGYKYIGITNDKNKTVISNINTDSSGEVNVDRIIQSGDVYVKNQGTALSQPLVDALGNTFFKYNSEVINDLRNNIVDFNIVNDSIFIETPSRLVIDKIKYNNEGKFTKPSTANTVFEIDTENTLTTISNTLYVTDIKSCNSEGAVFFAVFNVLDRDLITDKILPKNFWYVYPEIYQYDITSNSTVKVYPTNIDEGCLETFKTSYEGAVANFAPEKIKTVKLSYNSLHNKLKISYILLDQNNFSHIHDCTFEWRDGTLTLARVVRFNPDHLTLRTTAFSTETSFADVNVTSGGSFNIKRDVSNNLLCI
jgi:hypothetical protein